MVPVTTSISIYVIKHRYWPVLNSKSHIFAGSTIGKGISLFYLLIKTTTIRAGDLRSPAFFLISE